MSDAEYTDKNTIVLFPEVSGTTVTLEAAFQDNPTTKQTVGCCDVVRDFCDAVTSVTLRVKDPAGRTTRVYSSGVAGQWSRVPSATPTHSQIPTAVAVPTTPGGEAVLGLVIYIDDPASGTSLRRTQVVIIRHEPA